MAACKASNVLLPLISRRTQGDLLAQNAPMFASTAFIIPKGNGNPLIKVWEKLSKQG